MKDFKFTDAEENVIYSLSIDLDGREISFHKFIKGIEQIINERPDGWISVEERLPEIGESVILFADQGDSEDMYTCQWTAETERYYKLNHITHWQYHNLPSPPKTAKQ